MRASKLLMYTDGASRGNPGKGGYGTILLWGEKRKELSAAYQRTTNNRMELMAVIAGLEALNREGLHILIYSDSRYVVDAVQKGWLNNWLRKDFAGKKNPDLWLRFAELQKKHIIQFFWVKGHAQNALNNRCDVLATQAADQGPWQADEGFDASK